MESICKFLQNIFAKKAEVKEKQIRIQSTAYPDGRIIKTKDRQ